jgi:hypothetical protein
MAVTRKWRASRSATESQLSPREKQATPLGLVVSKKLRGISQKVKRNRHALIVRLVRLAGVHFGERHK